MGSAATHDDVRLGTPRTGDDREGRQELGRDAARNPVRFRTLRRLFIALVLPVLVLVGLFAVFAAPALAAAPEMPETTLVEPSATSAVLHGVLNPGGPGSPGSYQFSYAQSATECTPGALAPESPALAMGGEKEAESVTVTGLEPGREYSFCIVAYGLFGGVTEPAYGNSVAFKTPAAKPAVDGESTSGVSSTGATLEAQVNPNNESTSYVFEYSTKEKAGVLEGTVVKVPGSGPIEGFGDQTVSVPTGTLLAGTTYFYRVAAKNATGTTDGTVSATGFTTPPSPKTEAVTAVTATTATFHGRLKPLNEKVATEYAFDYNTGEESSCNGESRTEPVSAGTGKGTEATATTAVTGLQAHQKYTVCLVSINESGSQVDSSPVHFVTPAAAPAIEASSEKASNVTPYEATLEAQVNPDNEPTSYAFEYSTTESGGKLTGTITTLQGENPLEGGGEQTASAPTGHVLTPGTTYHFRITAKNGSGSTEGAGEFATPAASAPVIEGESASGVTAELATLEAAVNPEAQETTCSFEYGTEPALSSGVTTVPCPAALGSGYGATGTSVSLTGLIPSTTYYYRVTATNPSGTTTDSTIEQFETGPAAPPVVANEAASQVEQTAAVLEGEITPEHVATNYTFEYLTEAQYNENNKAFTGATTSRGANPIGAEEPATKVTAHITGLTASTSYVYRLTATSKCQAGKPCVTSGPAKTLTTPTPGSNTPGSCPNEARRNEQTFGKDLPDCRAYELVSPENTNGQDAISADGPTPRAAESGNAIAYTSLGGYGQSPGGAFYDLYISRRGPEGWGTENVSPLQYPKTIASTSPDEVDAFTPELTAGIVRSSASLTGEAPVEEDVFGLYRQVFGTPSYQYIGGATALAEPGLPLGESANLEDIAFGVPPVGYQTGIGWGAYSAKEWLGGRVVQASITNTGEYLSGSVGSQAEHAGNGNSRDTWHAVSTDGSRVIFTSPASSEEDNLNTGGQKLAPSGSLFQRINTGQPQSATVYPEVSATGTLAAGSDTVTSLAPILEFEARGQVTAGSHQLVLEASGTPFAAGQPVEGPGIPSGTTVVSESGATLTLSNAAIETAQGTVDIYRVHAFTPGERLTGYGLAAGTTVTAVNGDELTISTPAGVSASEVTLTGGGECTEPALACTVDVSASQRTDPDPDGPKPVRYWAASTNGSRIFFTSRAELTNDAYTGPEDNAANLYEYEAGEPNKPGTLKDLSVDNSGDGAAVGGVVQVSEDGGYVYFAAGGVLASNTNSQGDRATPEPCELPTVHETPFAGASCNLYVSRDGGAPTFIATLGPNDASDWSSYSYPEQRNELQTTSAGPASNAATVSPDGSSLAFVSEARLTNYDNDAAATGECEKALFGGGSAAGHCLEVYLYDASTGLLVCASCNPSGARPVGPAGVPGGSENGGQYRSRAIVADGSVFFNSSDALAGAAGGVENAFEFEDGRIYPLSDVAGGQPSRFLDASSNGENVFIASPNKLLPQAQGEVQAVYDARVDGGLPLPVTPEPCRSSETCAPGATAPPPAGAAASEAYAGPANPPPPPAAAKPKSETKAQKLAQALKVCHKDRKKTKRQACERQARKKYGNTSSAKKSATRATNDGRVSR
jgi:phosphodiesterase/alkaline phosphatase D-like protein